jgi:prevent-host-death family protein
MQMTGTGSDRIYTMKQFSRRTAGILKEVNDDGRPALITRRGRFIAMVTPITGENAESTAIGAIVDETDRPDPVVLAQEAAEAQGQTSLADALRDSLRPASRWLVDEPHAASLTESPIAGEAEQTQPAIAERHECGW